MLPKSMKESEIIWGMNSGRKVICKRSADTLCFKVQEKKLLEREAKSKGSVGSSEPAK